MKNAELFMEMAYASITLVKAYLMQDPANHKRSLYSAKLHLKSILKKAEVSSLAFVVRVRERFSHLPRCLGVLQGNGSISTFGSGIPESGRAREGKQR